MILMSLTDPIPENSNHSLLLFCLFSLIVPLTLPKKRKCPFNTLAAATNWDATALAWAFKRGLASHIKDKLAQVSPEPITLSELCHEVQ